MLESKELCWTAEICAAEQRSVLEQTVEGASPVKEKYREILEVAIAACGVLLLRK